MGFDKVYCRVVGLMIQLESRVATRGCRLSETTSQQSCSKIPQPGTATSADIPKKDSYGTAYCLSEHLRLASSCQVVIIKAFGWELCSSGDLMFNDVRYCLFEGGKSCRTCLFIIYQKLVGELDGFLSSLINKGHWKCVRITSRFLIFLPKNLGL